jgi:hypothetical protein
MSGARKPEFFLMTSGLLRKLFVKELLIFYLVCTLLPFA